MDRAISRRGFLATAASGAAAVSGRIGTPGAARPGAAAAPGPAAVARSQARPALLGGEAVRRAPFPSWPVVDGRDEKALEDVLHGGK